MEEVFKYSMLLDIYGNLLTKKQLNIMKNYFEENLSLNEIAENENTSRQAVFDMVKRGEKILSQYEDKLSLLNIYLKNEEIIEKIFKNLDKIKTDENYYSIQEIKKSLKILSRWCFYGVWRFVR